MAIDFPSRIMKPTMFFIFALFAATFAAAQSSSNYTVLSDTLDGGGLHSSSAIYTLDGSMGGFEGVVTANSPQEIARTGYAGQLYEVTALTLTAASTNLNEATSMPLYAVQFLDDGTVSPASSFAQWSFTGPIAGVNAAGLVTAANVYQNTPAVVLANLEGWTAIVDMLVINTGDDDYGIYAHDGIPDWWQVQYFGTNNPNGTGPKVLFDYVAGLNPTNPASEFSLSITALSGKPSIVFNPRLTNRTYTVQYANTPISAFSNLLQATVMDNGTTRTVTDTNAFSKSRFYRVQISYP